MLDNIRKSIDKSKQEGLNEMRTEMNDLYDEFEDYNIFSRNNIFSRYYFEVIKRFLIETIRRLRNGLSTGEQNILNQLFPNSNAIAGYNTRGQFLNELIRLEGLVSNRNSVFYRFKDRLEFLRKRSVGKRKKHYKKLLEYLENLQRISKKPPNRRERTNNETEFELENIRRINPDLYQALVGVRQDNPATFNNLFRILLNLPNRTQVYRYPNFKETLEFLNCLFDREQRVRRMLNQIPPLTPVEQNLKNRLRTL